MAAARPHVRALGAGGTSGVARKARLLARRRQDSVLTRIHTVLTRIHTVLTRIYTVGHSTRSREQLLEILRGAGVAALVDVRSFPSSRRHPQFNRPALAQWLPEAGIEYTHLLALGGRRRPHEDTPNTGWREPGFRGYADHMATAEFAAGLEQLEQLARVKPTAIMCAEALWWRCHRRLIADALTLRGWQVEHLGRNAPQGHVLTPFSHLGEDGALTYPAEQLSLEATPKEDRWDSQ